MKISNKPNLPDGKGRSDRKFIGRKYQAIKPFLEVPMLPNRRENQITYYTHTTNKKFSNGNMDKTKKVSIGRKSKHSNQEFVSQQ